MRTRAARFRRGATEALRPSHAPWHALDGGSAPAAPAQPRPLKGEAGLCPTTTHPRQEGSCEVRGSRRANGDSDRDSDPGRDRDQTVTVT